jgi:concentrative nucleoside transporter, CNT family
MNILLGILGILGIIAIGFGLSKHKTRVNWRTVGVALAVQLIFAFIVLKWEAGRKAIEVISNGVSNFIGYANEGINFVFGGLTANADNGFVFVIVALVPIIFLSAVFSILYYYGIMQKIVGGIGGALSKLLGTSKTESVSAAANIFLGSTEAPLLIKPYIKSMTKSQLFSVMVGGFASVAGSVLIGYAALGIPLNFLLAAAFMAAPAGLLMAKLMYPETEQVKEEDVSTLKDTESANVFDAAAKGASDGVQLVINIAAMLVAFIALVAMLNGIIGGLGNLVGLDITLDKIFGYVFAPLALIIGVPFDEMLQAGALIGQKTVLNEFVAYMNMSTMLEQLSEKTIMLLSFALCGFANLSVIAITLGGMATIAPSRRQEIAKLSVRALTAGVLANLLSAAIAGLFF